MKNVQTITMQLCSKLQARSQLEKKLNLHRIFNHFGCIKAKIYDKKYFLDHVIYFKALAFFQNLLDFSA